MDVDKSSKRIAVALFLSFEPEDACDDWVTAWGVGFENFAGAAAAFENAAKPGIATNFFGHLHVTEWCVVATRFVADSELGGGDFVEFDGFSVGDEQHFLIFNADDHLAAFIDPGGGVDAAAESKADDQAEDGKNKDAW